MGVPPAEEQRSERLSNDDKTEVGSGVVSPDPIPDEKEGQEVQEAADPAAPEEDTTVYPKGLTLFLIILSLCLAVFLVALDQTIIAPALGAITAEYQSVKDIVRWEQTVSRRMCWIWLTSET